MFVVVHADVSFRKPARYGDSLHVSCTLEERSRASMTFRQQVVRVAHDELLVEGLVRVACLDAVKLKPRGLPDIVVAAGRWRNQLMSDQMSPLELVLNASIIVQVVMVLLLIASVISWAIMLRKRAELRRARSDADRFEEVFWSGGDLSSMFRAIDQSRRVTSGMEAIFESGFREFTRLRQHGAVASAQLIEGSRRGMRVALLRETDRLEQGLSMLATVGSTSPYVGLFGTVWGIMGAFHGLGKCSRRRCKRSHPVLPRR